MVTKRHRTRVLACGLAAFGLLLGSRGAPAQNLLLDPSFDEDLVGWRLEPAAAPTWDPADVDGSAVSGSARVSLIGDRRGITQGILQYVEVVPGATYDLGAWIQVGGDPDVGGRARIFGSWFGQPGATPGAPCSAPASLFGMAEVLEEEAGAWLLRQELVSAPLDAHCALVKGAISKGEPTGEFFAHFDDFFFAPVLTNTPVTRSQLQELFVNNIACLGTHDDTALEIHVNTGIRCGQDGTAGEGLYLYRYFIESTESASAAAFREISIPFAAALPLDLDGDAADDTSAYCSDCTTFPVPTPPASSVRLGDEVVFRFPSGFESMVDSLLLVSDQPPRVVVGSLRLDGVGSAPIAMLPEPAGIHATALTTLAALGARRALRGRQHALRSRRT